MLALGTVADGVISALAAVVAFVVATLPADTLTSFASGWDGAMSALSPLLVTVNIVFDVPLAFSVAIALLGFRFALLHFRALSWAIKR